MGATDAPVTNQKRGHELGGIHRKREAQPLGRENDRRVDPHDLPQGLAEEARTRLRRLRIRPKTTGARPSFEHPRADVDSIQGAD